jgi:hypothetical protein
MCAQIVENVIAGRQSWKSAVVHGQKRNVDVAQDVSDFLDRVIPRDGASHAEVERYTVESPMRYATCFAVLANGKKVGLKNRRKFLGWSGWQAKRSYLFKSGELLIEVRTNPDKLSLRGVPGYICEVTLRDPVPADQFARANGKARKAEIRKFIARDGDQILLSAKPRIKLSELSRPQ